MLLLVAALLPIVLATGVLSGLEGSFGKAYHFPRVVIDATIEPDGTLALRERRTFEFRGEFSIAFFTIDPPTPPS